MTLAHALDAYNLMMLNMYGIAQEKGCKMYGLTQLLMSKLE